MTITVDDVAGIFELAEDKTSADLSTYLTTAQLIASEDLLNAGYSTARLDQITLYLAAHFAAISMEFGGIQSTKKGESTDTYKSVGSQAVGYASTRYGQQALAFDTKGILAASSKGNLTARFSVVKPVDSLNDGYVPLDDLGEDDE